ncbi:MAG: RDD family protein [Vicinamibacterales bacterium]
MKCPKCGYLGFETVDRCRNCGFDFSFVTAFSLPELSIRTAAGESSALLDDLQIVAPDARGLTDTPPASSVARLAGRREVVTDLPLFGTAPHEDAPLITRPSPPRQPLSVRRATPEVPRLRTEHRPSLLEQAEEGGAPPLLWRPVSAVPASAAPARATPVRQSPSLAPALETASLVARLGAGAVDVAVLLAVDLVVVYFTLQIVGLAVTDVVLLPRVPLATFAVLQALGYFTAFTAGGQTLGKMVTGIQVVAEVTDRAPTLPHALLRSLLWLILAVPAGLGLASVFLDAEKRGLHDRFARTRVVRATAPGIG